jgi:hypothetical protein
LYGAVLDECILNRMQLAIDRQTLHSHDLGAMSAWRWHQASHNGPAIQEDRACPAFSFCAAFLGSN